MVRSVSYRLPQELKAKLRDRAEREGIAETRLVVQLLEEGLVTRAHPGIVFRPGPSGRRAGLAGRPDVCEVVVGVRHAPGTGAEERVLQAATQMEVSLASVRIALDDAAAPHDEIESQIRSNEEAVDRLRLLTEARERLLT